MRVEESGISPKSNQIEILNEEKTDMASDVQSMATNNSNGQRLTMNVQVEKKCEKKKESLFTQRLQARKYFFDLGGHRSNSM